MVCFGLVHQFDLKDCRLLLVHEASIPTRCDISDVTGLPAIGQVSFLIHLTKNILSEIAAMYTIFADFNNSDLEGRVRLNTTGTFVHLENEHSSR
jgi:hypothetical protein